MAGLVNETTIREDLREKVYEEIQKNVDFSLVERAEAPEADQLVRPQERGRSTKHIDLDKFFVLFEKTLVAAKNLDGFEYPITLTSEYPDDEETLPILTTEVLDRDCFTAGKTKEYSFRLMKEGADPDYPGGRLTEYLRRMRNSIQITAWTLTSKERNRLATWIETKFYQYLWPLQWGGLGHPVIFEGRRRDITRNVRGNLIHGAPLQFTVITEEIVQIRSTQLRKIWYTVGLNNIDPDNLIT